MVVWTLRRYISSEESGRDLNFRPWTFLADLFTGVEKRMETACYDDGLIRTWIGSRNEIEFRDATNSMRAYWKPKILRGTTNEMMAGMGIGDDMRNSSDYYGMQWLRYKDGRARLTINLWRSQTNSLFP